jgi:cytochrome c-type biogenesis protein
MLETGILTGGFGLAALIALLAGVLSFLSPCVLPIVPPYVAYMGGISMRDLAAEDADDRAARWRTLAAAAFFVLGLSTVFLLLGFAASAFGRFIAQWLDWFNLIAGITIMVFGAHFLGIFRIGFLDRQLQLDVGDRGGSAFGAYILGLAFAFGWTPCIGPQLGMILSLAAQGESVGRGLGLLGIYALGLGIPFLLVAAFFPRLTGALGFLRRHMSRIERIMGLLLWTIGLLMLTGGFSQFSYWLLETFPALALVG